MYKRKCITCNTPFETEHPKYLNCSKKCNGIYRVTARYERDNGNWRAYFKHLLSKKKDSPLTVRQLLNMLERQNHRCALSGVEMTCIRKRGTIILTNASIDRIKAGEEYNSKNVQLVCRAVNSFRGTLPVKKYLQWCKKIVEHNKVN
jgi:hypothetical protein